ncbi:VOC family protein [Xanthomonas campestris]|uniref:VOC family protein n=2 Tax=Xanthomonas campestris TaxID=339 RepID=UPI001F443E0C|nr:VOC family protein [Xanthomonas campestris]WHO88756.1 VOC family protein [Xanthomonas campestris]
MSQAASSGLFIYAKDLERVAAFYQRVLGMQAIHSSKELVVLNAAALQLVIHAVPEAIAASITIADPPNRRENTALKFFFTVPSIAQLVELAAALGGEILLSASRKIDPAITRGLRHTSHQGDHQCARASSPRARSSPR